MKLTTPPDFDAFWLTGPWRKLGKDAARKTWNKTVKTAADFEAICSARDNYEAELTKRYEAKGKLRKDNEHYILHGSTWFTLWKDYAKLADNRKPGPVLCDYCKSEKHSGSDCEERRRDYATLQAKIKAATSKLSM